MQIAPLLNQTLPVHGSLSWKGVNYRYNIFNLQSTLGVNWIVAQLIEDTPTDLYIRHSSTWVYIDQDLFYKIRISVKLSLKYLLNTWLSITHENMDENHTRNINMKQYFYHCDSCYLCICNGATRCRFILYYPSAQPTVHRIGKSG